MIKKLSALFFSLLLIFSAACSRGSSPKTTTEEPTIPSVRITFREGLAASEIAALLEEKGVCSAADFLAEVKSPSGEWAFLSGIENAANRPFLLEGYLFPDTYDFYFNESAEKVLSRFLKNYQNKITAEYEQRAAEMGYTIDEVLTIASIIQEEAADPEMKKVSSVLHNRLNSAYGKLECDVTIFYLNDFVAPYVDDVSVYSEFYNAYKLKGLPAGPISNPGIKAIEAALEPDETDYYFFLTDKEGNYHYSVEWEEHSRKVEQYVD